MAEALKAQFGATIPRRIAEEIARVFPSFDRRAFERDALRGYESLELLDRGRHVARVLHSHLPAHFPDAVEILLATVPSHASGEGGMAAFYYLPHTDFVRTFGLKHFDASMRALHTFTQHFTGEFAIRPFLEHHQAQTLEQLLQWTRDPSRHVRRLVSEGTRPRLPWAPRLRAFQHDPTPVLALLEHLRDDPELYVRRSVANNLNDIGKDHPERLVDVATRWITDASAQRQWIVQHALRSAVKRGDRAALAVLGFGSASTLSIDETEIAPARPALGTSVRVTCTLRNPSRRVQRVVVDLIVHFVKSNGSANPKVFKMSVVELAAGASVTLRKSVSLADLTTRKHYVGRHRVDLQLNGATTSVGALTVVSAKRPK